METKINDPLNDITKENIIMTDEQKIDMHMTYCLLTIFNYLTAYDPSSFEDFSFTNLFRNESRDYAYDKILSNPKYFLFRNGKINIDILNSCFVIHKNTSHKNIIDYYNEKKNIFLNCYISGSGFINTNSTYHFSHP